MRRVAMAGGKGDLVAGEVYGVPITAGKLTTEVSCLVVPDSPFELIVGRPSMKEIRASIEFEKDVTTVRNHEGVTNIPPSVFSEIDTDVQT